METNDLKSLKNYVKECDYASPSNTIGMGNVSFPTDTTLGSGDTFQFRRIKRNKKLKLNKKSKLNNDIIEKLTLNSSSKITNKISKEDIRNFVSNHLSYLSPKVTGGMIKLLQKEISQWYVPSEIDKEVYNADNNKSPLKDLMLFTAKHFNITFEELWKICDESSLIFREIIQKINPQKFM